jgi:hypothetical protein
MVDGMGYPTGRGQKWRATAEGTGGDGAAQDAASGPAGQCASLPILAQAGTTN